MENNLQQIVIESGLEQTKSKIILDRFNDYFEIAHEWEQKAKSILITDDSQVAEMNMARVGRLFLREKRIAIEKTRKELKEQALREGKAIDGVANILKALICPIEEYLDKQEHFIEIKKAEEDARILSEAKKKEELERIAKEKAEEAERERVRIENAKMKEKLAKAEEEALIKDREAQAQKQNLLDEIKRQEAEKEAIKEKAEKEKVRQEAIKRKWEADRIKLENERREAEERAVYKEALRIKEEEERLRLEKALIQCPSCGHRFPNESPK